MNTTKLLAGLSIVLLIVAVVLLLVASVAIGVQAQDVEPDRISFYNDPSSHKFESHIDYADGREETKQYGTCRPGITITEPLNLYTAKFVTEGCEESVKQHLNLRWLGGCRFDFESDPHATIDAYGEYGTVRIAHGDLYPEGAVELPIPFGTTGLAARLTYTGTTGNVEFVFNEAIGCVDAPETPTPTETPVAVDTATAMPTATQTPTGTPTDETVIDCCLSTPVTPTPTQTATEMPTPTPTGIVGGQEPTVLDPAAEPGPGRMVFLPVVSR